MQVELKSLSDWCQDDLWPAEGALASRIAGALAHAVFSVCSDISRTEPTLPAAVEAVWNAFVAVSAVEASIAAFHFFRVCRQGCRRYGKTMHTMFRLVKSC